MKRTFLATSIALALGFSAPAYAQPTLNDDNNFAEGGSYAMDDDNNVGSTLTETETEESYNTDNGVEHEDSYNTVTETETETEESYNTDNSVEHEDSYNTVTETETDESYNTDNSVEHEDSYNTETETEESYNTVTSTETETETEDSYNTDNSVEHEDSYNTVTETETETEDSYNTITETETETEDSYNTETRTADNASFAMDDGNTVQVSTTEIAIGDISVDLALNSSELAGEVSGTTVNYTLGDGGTPGNTLDANNRIAGGSMNFTGVGVSIQNSGASSLNQSSVNVQSNLAF